MRTPILAALVLSLAAAAPAPTTNEKIAAFCKSKLGEPVGGGECAHLASEALKSVGIPRRAEKDAPNPGDYVWGDLVLVYDASAKPPLSHGKLADLKPGDIIQYRDTKWAGPKRTARGTYTATAGHHTSVIRAVEDKGKTIKIYQQNSGGKRFVTEDVLYLDDLKEGWIRVYRAAAK
jgi:hypothetical protein